MSDIWISLKKLDKFQNFYPIDEAHIEAFLFPLSIKNQETFTSKSSQLNKFNDLISFSEENLIKVIPYATFFNNQNYFENDPGSIPYNFKSEAYIPNDSNGYFPICPNYILAFNQNLKYIYEYFSTFENNSLVVKNLYFPLFSPPQEINMHSCLCDHCKELLKESLHKKIKKDYQSQWIEFRKSTIREYFQTIQNQLKKIDKEVNLYYELIPPTIQLSIKTLEILFGIPFDYLVSQKANLVLNFSNLFFSYTERDISDIIQFFSQHFKQDNLSAQINPDQYNFLKAYNIKIIIGN